MDAPPAFGNAVAGSHSLARQATLAHGLPLWPWLALAALLCLTLEALIHAKGAGLKE
jgi:hypothetical protein